ncbi:hypothetical protein HYW20_00990 [Candidatus Woesearchaeota archaeon]|nr:hypothetical protein [Candidatus Woesearchaeota archaeon]
MQKTVETAKVGDDWTVKLPQDARKTAGLKRGETIVVLPLNRTLVLGKISKKFLDSMERMGARKKNISPSQVNDLIQKVRYSA